MSFVEVFFNMVLRLGIGFMALVVYMNLLGRMQLAPQSSIDQIGNYILGGILGGIIYNLDLEFYKFFMAIIIWTAMMLVVTFITQRSLRAKRVIKGKPTLLMENNIFLIDEFRDNKVNLDDLMSKLHQMGVYSVKTIDTIWLEPNGQLTVIQKDDPPMPWVLIENGEVNQIDLERLKKDRKWLDTILAEEGVASVEDVFYGEYLSGKLIVYRYD